MEESVGYFVDLKLDMLDLSSMSGDNMFYQCDVCVYMLFVLLEVPFYRIQGRWTVVKQWEYQNTVGNKLFFLRVMITKNT